MFYSGKVTFTLFAPPPCGTQFLCDRFKHVALEPHPLHLLSRSSDVADPFCYSES